MAYVRVSQARDGMISPELQARAIEDYCQRHHFVLTETLQDLDLSGRFWKLRQVERAIQMIETDQADVIVVWRWSRVSRNRLDWAMAVDRVEAAGGRLESATEGFDTSTSTGRLARGMLAELAAFESDRTGDIWREVWSRRAQAGLPSHGHNILGYRKKDTGYVPDRRTGPIVAELYQRYVDGSNHLQLTHWLNGRKVRTPRTGRAWTANTLTRAMDNGFAAGYIRYQNELRPGAHRPLIDEQLWQAYLTRRDQRRQSRTPVGDHYLLTDILWCGCGHPMRNAKKTGPRGRDRYICWQHPPKKSGTTMSQQRCDGMIRRWLFLLVTDETAAQASRTAYEAWTALQGEKAQQLRHQLSTNSDDEREATLSELEAVRIAGSIPDPRGLARALLEDWDILGAPALRQRLRRLVEKVEVHADRAEPLLCIHTTWGSVESFIGLSAQKRYPAESLPVETLGDTAAPPMVAPDPLHLLTPGEASRVAQVELQTLRLWDRAGHLPNTRHSTGLNYLYDIQDLRRMRPKRRPTGGAATRKARPASARTEGPAANT